MACGLQLKCLGLGGEDGGRREGRRRKRRRRWREGGREERKEGKGFNTLNNFIRMNSLSLSASVCFLFTGTFSHPCVSVCVLIGPSAPNPKNLVFSAGIFLLQLIYLKVTPHPRTHTHTSRQSPLQNTSGDLSTTRRETLSAVSFLWVWSVI